MATTRATQPPPAEGASERGVNLVLVATAALALKGIWARLAYAEGLDVSAVLFYRSALSAPLFLLGTLWFIRRSRHGTTVGESAGSGGPTAKSYALGAALGAMFSVGMFCDFEAIRTLGAGVSRVLLFGYPLIVLVLQSLTTGRLPSSLAIVGFCVAWSGLLCVASPHLSQSTGPANSLRGPESWTMTWGFLSMGFYAVYVFLSGKLTKSLGSVRLTGISNLSTSAIVIAFLLSSRGGDPPEASSSGIAWVFLMVVVSTVGPYFLMMEGIVRLGSSRASLLSMNGPVVTLLAGYLVLGERVSSLQILGTVLTLAGVAVATRR